MDEISEYALKLSERTRRRVGNVNSKMPEVAVKRPSIGDGKQQSDGTDVGNDGSPPKRQCLVQGKENVGVEPKLKGLAALRRGAAATAGGCAERACRQAPPVTGHPRGLAALRLRRDVQEASSPGEACTATPDTSKAVKQPNPIRGASHCNALDPKVLANLEAQGFTKSPSASKLSYAFREGSHPPSRQQWEQRTATPAASRNDMPPKICPVSNLTSCTSVDKGALGVHNPETLSVAERRALFETVLAVPAPEPAPEVAPELLSVAQRRALFEGARQQMAAGNSPRVPKGPLWTRELDRGSPTAKEGQASKSSQNLGREEQGWVPTGAKEGQASKSDQDFGKEKQGSGSAVAEGCQASQSDQGSGREDQDWDSATAEEGQSSQSDQDSEREESTTAEEGQTSQSEQDSGRGVQDRESATAEVGQASQREYDSGREEQDWDSATAEEGQASQSDQDPETEEQSWSSPRARQGQPLKCDQDSGSYKQDWGSSANEEGQASTSDQDVPVMGSGREEQSTSGGLGECLPEALAGQGIGVPRSMLYPDLRVLHQELSLLKPGSAEPVLVHTQSIYRRKLTPARTVEPVDDAPAPPREDVLSQVLALCQEATVQEGVMKQASRALDLCHATAEFSGSAEQVEGERLLLLSTERRQACLAEAERLKTQASCASGERGIMEHASLTLSGLQLPLKREFLAAQLEGTLGGDVHHFLCLVKQGPHVLATQMLSTSDHGGQGALSFTNHMTLRDLKPNFLVAVHIYALQTEKETLPHHRKYRIGSKAGSKLKLTPKGSKKCASNKTPPVSQAAELRRPSFGLVGVVHLTLGNCRRSTFNLDKVPANSPLEGTLVVQLKLRPQHHQQVKGFLTMFEDVGGFGAWHRRWCLLANNQLSFWRYPEHEGTKEPTGCLDLHRSSDVECRLVSRDICARPFTIAVGIAGVQHLLSADTKEEARRWCLGFNAALHSSRVWQC